MRMLVYVDLPVEPFNSMVRDGTAGGIIQEILAEIEPEAVYFSTTGKGHRGGIMVVDVNDPSELPAIAEPFFLKFNADIDCRIAMTPEDLGRAGLDELGKAWG